MLGVVPEWEPVLSAGLTGAASGGLGAKRALGLDAQPAPGLAAERDAAYRAGIERRAAAAGLQAWRWPEPYPTDTRWAMLVATYTKQIGRAVAYSLAAFRQAFAGGRDLAVRDNVLIAAAACELHPLAVVKGAELASTRRRLEAATTAAAAAGVRSIPAVRIGGRVLHADELDTAGARLAKELGR